MKSTTYEEMFGAARTGPPGFPDLDPDTVEEILVEIPITLELTERMFSIARSRVVGANAKWVYTYYLLVGHYSGEKLSLRATAKTLHMPWTTFWRARKELEQASVIIPIVTGVRGSIHRLLVRDIREVVQNEPIEPVVQNEPLGIARPSRAGKVKVLISSKNRYNYDGVTPKIENKETLFGVGHKSFDDLDEAFGPPPPKVQRASAPTRPFKLQPPPGPQTEPASSRVSTRQRHQKVPWSVYEKVYEVCFGAKTHTAREALGKSVKGRINTAIHSLLALDADLSRIGEFLTWWRTWARAGSRPTPEVLVTHWLNAMEQIEEEIRKQTNTWVGSLSDVSDDEYEKIVAALKERTRREHKGVAQ